MSPLFAITVCSFVLHKYAKIALMNKVDMTTQTYIQNFDLYKEKTPHKIPAELVMWLDDFINLLPKQGHLLELGSANGREARYLRDKGFIMTCTDIIPQAIEELRSDNFEAYLYDFRDAPKKEWADLFDGFIANAVYLHATKDIFEKSLTDITSILKINSILCITFKLGEGEEIETEKLEGERYFKYYTKEELVDIIKQHKNLELLSLSESDDTKWIQLLLKKRF